MRFTARIFALGIAVILPAGMAVGQAVGMRLIEPKPLSEPARPKAQRVMPRKPAVQTVQPAAAQEPAPVAVKPPVPLRPSEMPAVPPRVSLVDGALTIVAENSTMADIITQLRAATGIKIETIGGPSGERVAARIGPAPIRDVILSLVQGSGYDFIILGVEGQPNAVERVILTPKSSGGAVTASAPQRGPSTYNTVYTPPQPEPTDDDGNEGFAPVAQPMPLPANSTPSEQPAVPGATQLGTNQPKTPEQLLEELRRMEELRNNPQGRPQRPPR
ncbi:MAG: hypothetical protein ABIP12_04920 [Terriglobales bacterium]